MMHKLLRFLLAILLVFSSLNSQAQRSRASNYLVLAVDSVKDEYAYKNQQGEIVIPFGKYSICYTDTFKTYAIVAKPNVGFVAIDRQENVLYQVLPFDNGPDDPADGLFRIIANTKIGYASAATGKVVIKPQFDCAWPFKRGLARVSMECTVKSDGEHSFWLSEKWYYIDKTGRKISSEDGKHKSNIR